MSTADETAALAAIVKTMRRMAAEQIADLVAVDTKLKAIQKELHAAVQAGART